MGGQITVNDIPMICENCNVGTFTSYFGVDGNADGSESQSVRMENCALSSPRTNLSRSRSGELHEELHEDIECAAAVHGVLDGRERCALSKDISLSSISVNREDWNNIFNYQKANQWVLVANVHPRTVANKTYWEGVCANRGDMAFNDTMKIVMGEVTDYFRPTEDMTLCDS